MKKIKQSISSGLMEIGYHGSGSSISCFTEDKVGIGADSNSALGLFTTQLIDSAMEYAISAQESGEGDCAIVHVLAMPSKKIYIMSDFDEFYGLEHQDKDSFTLMRNRLIAQNYDGVQYENGEDVIFVCLNPQEAVIVARLSPEQAEYLNDALFDGAGVMDLLEKGGHLITDMEPRVKKTRVPSGGLEF